MSRNLTSLPRTACWTSSSGMTARPRPSTGPWSGRGRGSRGTRSGCSGGTPAWRTGPGTGGGGGCWIPSYVNHLICIDIDNIYSVSGGPP